MKTKATNESAVIVTKEIAEIRRHRDLYYNKSKPEISDASFDKLVSHVRKHAPNSPVLKEVGARPTSVKKRRLHSRMGSLDNAMGAGEFGKWYDKIVKDGVGIVIQDKLDGCSLELVYEGGLLQHATTRGDGIVGEDVMHNATLIPDIPMRINLGEGHAHVERIRGEVLLARAEMDRPDMQEYSTPRNAASGILRRLDGRHAERLSFRAFDYQSDTRGMDSEKKALAYLAAAGFKVVDSRVVGSRGSHAVKMWEDRGEERSTLPFDLDGQVVKVNSRADQAKIQQKAGRGRTDDPAWAVAFKWPEQHYDSVVEEIVSQVGRTGTLTPVAIIKTVNIGGANVSRASLCNFDEVARLKVGVGSTVKVVRSGEIIPKVLSAGPCKRVYTRPKECPVCEFPTVEDGPRQLCVNPTCAAQVEGRLHSWAAKRNIMGFGPAVAASLAVAGFPKITDMYEVLTKGLLARVLDSEALSEKLWSEITKSMKTTLADMVGSIGIDGIGRREAEILVGHGFDTLEKMLAIRSKDLMVLPGYKETKSDKIVRGLAASAKTLRKLESLLTVEAPPEVESRALEGQSFCFTGCRPTAEQEAKIKAHGGTIKSGVSKGLTFLVCKEANATSDKAKKAKELGTRVISYSNFQHNIGA